MDASFKFSGELIHIILYQEDRKLQEGNIVLARNSTGLAKETKTCRLISQTLANKANGDAS